MTPTHLPRDYNDLALHLAQYLHREGIVPDPLAGQGENDVGVFINGWVDQPDTAVSITTWEPIGRDSDTLPEQRFMVAHRAPTQPEVWELQRSTFHALHRGGRRYELTADMHLLICERVVSDPPVPDQNTRWVAVDTYRCRPYRNHH